GEKDPQFGKDVAFYAFDLPWYRFLLGFGFATAPSGGSQAAAPRSAAGTERLGIS
ncbi:UPF0182 family protein, partial [Streptomyces albidoflavus]